MFDAIVIDLDSHVCTYKEKGLKTASIAAPPQYNTNNEDNLKIWERVGSEIWSAFDNNLRCYKRRILWSWQNSSNLCKIVWKLRIEFKNWYPIHFVDTTLTLVI